MNIDPIPKLSPEQIAVLEAQNEITLADWWCICNSWEWIDALGPPPERPRDAGKRDLADAVMIWIEEKIPFKEILRAWNTRAHKYMTDEVFEEWWNKRIPTPV